MIDMVYGLADNTTLPAGEDGCCDVRFAFFTYYGPESGKPEVSIGKVEEIAQRDANHDGLRICRLTGIPEGGPYTLDFSYGSEHRMVYHNLYVRRRGSTLPPPPHYVCGFSSERKDGQTYVVRGLASGAVLQRGTDDRCDIRFVIHGEGEVTVSGIDCELCETGKDPYDSEREFSLRGIAVGGPYSFTLMIGETALPFDNVYVGDNWLCSGQSNMEANAPMTDYDRAQVPDETVRYLSKGNEWLPATPVLKGYGGVTCAYYFARKMREYTGVPQGIVHYAVGGSPLYTWKPSDEPVFVPSRYGTLIRRALLAGGRVRGVFWFQGCAEARRPLCQAIFTENMKELVSAFRRDLGDPKIPFVQCQVCRWHWRETTIDSVDHWWSEFRAKQLGLSEEIDNLDTVTAITAKTVDGLHIDATAQRQVGTNAAEAMMHMIAPDDDRFLPYIRPEKINVSGDRVFVRFKNLHGDLTASGNESGFALTESTHVLTGNQPYAIELRGDTAVLKCCMDTEELRRQYLYYGFGNSFYCNITDSAGRPIPAFGPVSLAEAENL